MSTNGEVRGYDADFITHLYRICLDREPDPEGFETHFAALRSGVPPDQVVRGFLQCDEFAEVWRRKLLPRPDLPDLKSIYPDHYENDLYLAINDNRIHRMEGLISDYHYYDSFGVWGSVIDFDKMTMADLVSCTDARSCLEVGCFNGTILSILKQRGLAVTGVDLSHLAFVFAYSNIRDHLLYGDLLSVTSNASYDCILLLDIMEHISPLKIRKHIYRLRSLLNSHGVIIMNSPMFGVDEIFGNVFPQEVPNWRDLGDSSFFRHWPCDAKGWPMHGHMIWASPKWWSRQFEEHDLIRQSQIEQQIQKYLAKYFARAPARKSLTIFGHRNGNIDVAKICEAIGRNAWAS